MSKNVLSIDFTYFQKATIEALRSYPEDIDKETYLSTLLWACHYLDAVQGVLTRCNTIKGHFKRVEMEQGIDKCRNYWQYIGELEDVQKRAKSKRNKKK